MTVPVLTILDGLQAGSRTTLAGGGSLIGTGTDCAVVVADPTMGSDHFEVVVGETTMIRALRRLDLADGSSLAPGSQVALSGSTAFTAGGTRFLIELPVAEAQAVPATPPRRRRRALTYGTAAVAAGMVLGGSWLAGRGPGAVRPIETAAASVALRHPAADPAERSAAVAALRSRVAAAGLVGVSVASEADGTVVASGLLGTGDEPAWSGVRQWFDARYGNDVVIVERFGAPGALPPLRIAAVWAGPDPYVVDDRGQRLHPGAAVGEGWFVDRIADNRVMMRRGAQTVALRYQP